MKGPTEIIAHFMVLLHDDKLRPYHKNVKDLQSEQIEISNLLMDCKDYLTKNYRDEHGNFLPTYQKGEQVVVYQEPLAKMSVIGQAQLKNFVRAMQHTERWEAVFRGENKIKEVTIERKF